MVECLKGGRVIVVKWLVRLLFNVCFMRTIYRTKNFPLVHCFQIFIIFINIVYTLKV